MPDLGGFPVITVFQVISISERDVVYPLNGELVRSDVRLSVIGDTDACMPDKAKATIQDRVFRSVEDFASALLDAKRFAPIE